ncbi:MAG: threonine/serine dehydratase [Rhizobiales bacterium]|nr:threonine/serine dehydratase [Hyphomicrobiales bacterium]
MRHELPTFADIEAAAARLKGLAAHTPLLENAALNELAGGRVLLKAETLQRTGSFKFRGAWNCIAQLPPEQVKGGVVAYSSGNHAQGVAAAARLRGMPALIVMPCDTPLIKQERTKSFGAEVVLYDRATEDREAIARRIADERGAVIVPPFEHPHIIAGQGTVGLELAAQAREAGAALDTVLCGASGGGLIAGIALALEKLSPATRITVVEPEGFDDHRRSLISGQREKNERAAGSICDALLSAQPGQLTFAINQSRLAGGITVSEDEVRRAVAFAFAELKLVVEPGGAVSLAAVLAGKVDTKGRSTGLVLTGGNVDPALFAEMIRGAG